MPFYPALPDYKPAVGPLDKPFTSLIGGFGAAQDVLGQMAKTKLAQEAAQQPARQREAMQAMIAGDPTKLQVVNPELAMRWDDKQREVASKAAEYISANAPYVTTPEEYGAFRENFLKLHQSVNPAMLPPAEKISSPEQVKYLMNRGTEHALDLQRRLGQVKGEQTVTTEKALSRDVRMPEQEQLFKLKGQLQDKVDKAHYDLSTTLADKRIGFEREIKEDQTLERREHSLLTNFRYEMNQLDRLEAELEKEVDKQMLPEEQARMMKQELRYNMNAKRNRAAEYYRPFAEAYKIPWRPPREPEKNTSTGPPLGTDPAFDRAMARAGNNAALQQAVISRWQSLNPQGVPAAPMPAPAPVAPPAAAPVRPAPIPATAPAPTPAPVSAPIPQPAPVAKSPVKIPTTPTEYGKATDDEIAELRKQRIIEELGGEIDIKGLGYGENVGKVVDWVLDSANRAEREQRKADLEWLRKKQTGR